MPVKRQCEKCNATASEGIHLFKFPSNINIRRAWIRFVNNDFIPKSYSTLCSKHFDKNDVIQNKVRVKLRPGAIPLTGTKMFGRTVFAKFVEVQKMFLSKFFFRIFFD